jgi:uncharacterized membrane protein
MAALVRSDTIRGRRPLSEGDSVSAERSRRRLLDKSRMEAFSDGVLAIAVTLLVLDLALRPPGDPLRQFLEGWPTYLAYVVSFLTIGAAWIDHNALTDQLDKVDTVFLRLNLLFLLLVAFLPFPTRLVAQGLEESIDPERVAVVVYGITLLAIQLSFWALAGYARREHLLAAGEEGADLREERWKFRWAVAGYAVTIAIGFAYPPVAVALYLAIAVFLVVPFRAVAELFAGEPPE